MILYSLKYITAAEEKIEKAVAQELGPRGEGSGLKRLNEDEKKFNDKMKEIKNEAPAVYKPVKMTKEKNLEEHKKDLLKLKADILEMTDNVAEANKKDMEKSSTEESDQSKSESSSSSGESSGSSSGDSRL